MASPNSSTVSLKLLIDSKHQKVLFAEAGKDFVDFLFTLVSLPVGTVIRLLSKEGMVGSFGKLYESVENLSDTYMQPNQDKDILLKPKAPVAGPNIFGLLNNVESPARNAFYMCSQNCNSNYHNIAASHRFVTENPDERCPQCNNSMSSEATYVGQPKTTVATSGAGAAGYVKDVVTYMIMDDLEVKPMSTISSITMLNRFNVKDVGALEEKIVGLGMDENVKDVVTYMIMDDLEVKPMSTISSITMLNRFNVKDVGALEEKIVGLGMDEGVKLLKESLQSKSVLTNVFLGKKAAEYVNISPYE